MERDAMTRRQLIAISCCVLMSAAMTLAQSRSTKPAKADPITGTWSGEFVLGGERHLPVKMVLKLDGKGAVSGTVDGLPNPGDVKSGSYDAKTGALKLQLGRSDSPATLLTLEGKVDKGIASGTFTGDDKGTFTITKKG
jgi:hypothetical protein